MGMLKPLEQILNQLPPEAQHEVEDFARFLLGKKVPKRREKPKFEWAGCLKNYEPSQSSVDIQHEIAKWRGEEL